MKAIGILVLFYFLNGFGSSFCVEKLGAGEQKSPSAFRYLSADQMLEELSHVETTLFNLEPTLRNPQERARYLLIHDLFDLTFQELETSNQDKAATAFEKLKKELSNFQKEIDQNKRAQAISTLEALQEDPLLVQPQKVYRSEQSQIEVSFSNSVIREVFYSKSDLRKRAVKMSLHSLIKGVIPNFSKGANGVKITEPRDGVFEVCIIAASIGQFRFLGYIDNQQIYRIVHFYENSDHSQAVRSKQVEIVLNRKMRGEK